MMTMKQAVMKKLLQYRQLNHSVVLNILLIVNEEKQGFLFLLFQNTPSDENKLPFLKAQ